MDNTEKVDTIVRIVMSYNLEYFEKVAKIKNKPCSTLPPLSILRVSFHCYFLTSSSSNIVLVMRPILFNNNSSNVGINSDLIFYGFMHKLLNLGFLFSTAIARMLALTQILYFVVSCTPGFLSGLFFSCTT